MNAGFPLSVLSTPNSIKNVPPPAVHVIGVSPSGTPCLKFTYVIRKKGKEDHTVPKGIPVVVINAGRSLFPKSKANSRSSPL